MKGDFSRWDIDEIKKENFNGVLHQQGRVLLDNDWNAAARITNAWQDQNGRDVIGPGVAAVPAEVPDSFKVQNAEVRTIAGADQVVLYIKRGRVWADGLLTYLPGEEYAPPIVRRIATYLEPPFQDADNNEDSIGSEVRDAVILEVWREAINGFQMKDKLIEPALGGPDTTERVHTAMAFRLLRLEEGENCENIRDRLKDDPAKMGTLKVSLQPSETINGECPVEQGGGYTGFEHHLYRIEIAQVDRDEKMFKWSRFNGGLVGRGKFESGKVNITDNFQAITTSGLTSFYLEAVKYNEVLGHWEVTYGAEVTLNSDNQLDLESTVFGGVPSANNPVFFRLWDGIKSISKFPLSTSSTGPTELQYGILLEFDDTNTGKFYRPGDYWTFEVRAGDKNEQVLIDTEPPHGILYHRVPLAILNWNEKRQIDEEFIDDCRVIFHPLTKLKGCCTVTVGPGGDFDKIQNAVDYLDNTDGGLICILPGVYQENVKIEGKKDIIIRGCDKRTLVIPGENMRDIPIFHIKNSQGITLEHMRIVAFNGIAVSLEGEEGDGVKEIEICNNTMIAFENAIHVNNSTKVKIRENKIRMIDKEGGGAAIFMMAEDSLVRGNDIGVVPAAEITPPPGETDDDGRIFLFDPCLDWEKIYGRLTVLFYYVNLILKAKIFIFRHQVFKTVGGIQIAGGCDGVKILENRVTGGSANGITLGNVSENGTATGTGSGNTTFLEGTIVNLPINKDIMVKLFLINTNKELIEQTQGNTLGDGQFNFNFSNINPGQYEISVYVLAAPPDIDFDIEHIKVSEDFNIREEYKMDNYTYFIHIEAKKEDETLAFIYDVLVEDNEILNMGLSGIGAVWFIQPTAFRAAIAGERTKRSLSNPVEKLTIRQNHIFNCLQNPYDIYKAEVQHIGLGGISLGICEDVTIFGNRIENNGINHIYPVCGIYIYDGEFVDISHNIIVNNGPLQGQVSYEFRDGIRGGIIIVRVSVPPKQAEILNQESLLSYGKPAARVHDNVVDQPVGKALTIRANGPLSILNNQFNSELSEPGDSTLKIGTVKIINVNIDYQAYRSTAASNSETLSTGYLFPGVYASRVIRQVPKCNTLFNNNQTRMGLENKSHISQVIISSDDIGFDGNQSDDIGEGFSITLPDFSRVDLVINTILIAPTLRATDNRFKESIEAQTDSSMIISLITHGNSLNNTTNNQGDHCIFAYGGSIVEPGNQVLYLPEKCEKYKGLFAENGTIGQLIKEHLPGG